MSELRFEWNPAKASSNLTKHKVSFEEARMVFYDENAILIHDPEHSRDEERFLLLGMSPSARFLVVCHCEREDGNVIRIISARKAERTERAIYLRRIKP
jgi:uncharacterized DUF497 family protein